MRSNSLDKQFEGKLVQPTQVFCWFKIVRTCCRSSGHSYSARRNYFQLFRPLILWFAQIHSGSTVGAGSAQCAGIEWTWMNHQHRVVADFSPTWESSSTNQPATVWVLTCFSWNWLPHSMFWMQRVSVPSGLTCLFGNAMNMKNL